MTPMSSPEKKRKTMTTTTKELSLNKKKKPPKTPNPSLPDDLLLSCFARVSILYYPTLSLVSKSFQSLITSPELYKIRSSLGNTENCLYICIEITSPKYPRWFTLCRRLDRTITTSDVKKNKKSSGYVLAKLPTPHSRPAHWSGLVTVGSNIYNIGGPLDDNYTPWCEPSSSVSILDSRSNTWQEGPSLLVKRKFPVASVLDGKIYVAGGCKDLSSSSDWMEVFDPKKQTWERVSSPGGLICGDRLTKSAVIDGKVYIFGSQRALAYKPREGRWEKVGMEMEWGWPWYSYCVIDNVLYSYNEGEFKWYDTKVRDWRVLKGVKGLPKFPLYSAKLADYGGKMVVLWDRVVAYEEKMILCAVIALERRNSKEIWGKVEWYDIVLTVPKSSRVNYALATTV